MPQTLLASLFIACAVELLFMLLLFCYGKRIHNAGIVDIGWSFSITLLAIIFCLRSKGYSPRLFLMAVMAVGWGLRLSIYIFWRGKGKGEDPRYEALRQKWGDNQDRKMLEFYLLQGAVAVFFSTPFLFASLNPSRQLSWLEGLSFLIWIVSFTGESLADKQLYAFKSNPAHQGQTCNVGLWRYSRHPNYFFEWLTWCSFSLFALGSPYGWVSILCPVLIYHFLVNVTGIPTAEAQSLKSRGENYRQYQKVTSKFFPRPPRDTAQEMVNPS